MHDFQAAQLVYLIIFYFREDRLLLEAQGVVAAPSKESAGTPWNSRMRGSTALISLSRKSYMRSPRSVTLRPMGIPARSLKLAMDLRGAGDHRMLPGDGRQVFLRRLQRLGVGDSFAQADVEHHLFQARHLHDVSYSRRASIRPGTTSFVYFSLSLAILVNHLVAGAAESDLPPVLQFAITDPGGLVALVAQQHDVGDVQAALPGR